MEAALGWIGAIFEWLGRFLPRWDLVRANEKGVKYLPGGRTKVLEPGIRWYWPATTEVVVAPVCRQVLNAQGQALMTKDHKPVYASGLVIYSVEDIHIFLVDNFDAEASLDDVLQTAIRNAIVTRTFDEIQEDLAEINRLLTRETKKVLRDFGVKVEAARLTEFSLSQVFNVVGNGLTQLNVSGAPPAL